MGQLIYNPVAAPDFSTSARLQEQSANNFQNALQAFKNISDGIHQEDLKQKKLITDRNTDTIINHFATATPKEKEDMLASGKLDINNIRQQTGGLVDADKINKVFLGFKAPKDKTGTTGTFKNNLEYKFAQNSTQEKVENDIILPRIMKSVNEKTEFVNSPALGHEVQQAFKANNIPVTLSEAHKIIDGVHTTFKSGTPLKEEYRDFSQMFDLGNLPTKVQELHTKEENLFKNQNNSEQILSILDGGSLTPMNKVDSDVHILNNIKKYKPDASYDDVEKFKRSITNAVSRRNNGGGYEYGITTVNALTSPAALAKLSDTFGDNNTQKWFGSNEFDTVLRRVNGDNDGVRIMLQELKEAKARRDTTKKLDVNDIQKTLKAWDKLTLKASITSLNKEEQNKLDELQTKLREANSRVNAGYF